MQIPRTLHDAFGHVDMGIYASVTVPGEISRGEQVTPAAVARLGG